MIQKIARTILYSYYKPVEDFLEDPLGTQQRTLQYLLKHGRNTLYGKRMDFSNINNYTEFSKKVPIISYEDLKPYLEKIIIKKEENVLWDTPIKWFAMSSGTTEDKSKYIPVTKESLFNGNYKAGYYMLGTYALHHPETSFVLGKTLVMGGSQQINHIGDGIFTGDISAILMKNLPRPVKKRRTPEEIALLPDWEDKLERLTEYAKKTDIRALIGVPSWMLVLLNKIVNDTGMSIIELWPDIEVFFHGGVSFPPFKQQFDKIIPSNKMNYWESYNASEGFFGVQFTPESNDMLLILDNEVFYEFIPVEKLDEDNSEVVPLEGVKIGKQYAMLISTSGGLWRYKIGDTIQFSSIYPHLFKLTGRTKQFINAFGEELIVDNADRAIADACLKTGAKFIEYTAAPIYFSENHNGAHEWLIEFETEPSDINEFTKLLDESLKKLNSDYEAKRSYNLSLNTPIIRTMEKGVFYNWMKHREKIGGQNKVPKLANDRRYVDSILDFVSNKS